MVRLSSILLAILSIAFHLNALAEVPTFQTGPNSTVGTVYPGRIVLNNIDNPSNPPPEPPCPTMDATGNATAYTCVDIVRDTSLRTPILVREVTSPSGEIFYQTLGAGFCCAMDDNGISGNSAQQESFVRSSRGTGGAGAGGEGIKLDQRIASSTFLTLPTTETLTGSPVGLPATSGTHIFTGFADTRLKAPALQDVDQQALAPSFDDPSQLVSVRIRENGNAFGALHGNSDFNYAATSDNAGKQLSSEVSVVSDYLLNSLDGVVFDTSLGTIVPSKWRADIKDHQLFSFRSRSAFDSNGNQVVTGTRVDLSQSVHFLTASPAYLGSGAIRDINLNPNHDPGRSAPEGGANGQAVWDDYDMNFVHIISLTGDMITAPADGGLGDGNPGITLGGNTLIWPAGTPGNNQERLTSTFVAQRMAFRRFVGDVQNNTSQTATYYDGTGAKSRVSQTGGADPFSSDNNGTVWDWDLAFAPIGTSAPQAPAIPPTDPFLTTTVPNPFLNPTIPSCLPSDPNGTTGAC